MKFAEVACHSSAKNAAVRMWAVRQVVCERRRTHLAHMLTVTCGEDGDLEVDGG